MKIQSLSNLGFSILARYTSSAAFSEAERQGDLAEFVYDYEATGASEPLWFGPGLDVDTNAGFEIEHADSTYTLEGPDLGSGMEALAEECGRPFSRDHDPSEENLARTFLELPQAHENYDILILLKELQRFSGGLSVILDVPEEQPFEPSELRWELVGFDEDAFPNPVLYGSEGEGITRAGEADSNGEGFVTQVAYGDISSRPADRFGEPYTGRFEGGFDGEAEGQAVACVVLRRKAGEQWTIDESLSDVLRDALGL